MASVRQPFLVQGREAFLNGFKFFNGKFNADISKLHFSVDGEGKLLFSESSGYGIRTPVDEGIALAAILKLGKTGAYTYELGRFWALRTLLDQEKLIAILSRRFPHILIDEAQDVGTVHGTILSALQSAGTNISLIGDPNQAIYEFADADGTFLNEFDPGVNGLRQSLTVNRRSIQPIVDVANLICKTDYKSSRNVPDKKHGSFFLTYKSTEIDQLVSMFATFLKAHGYAQKESAVLARGTPLVDQLSGGIGQYGQGATELFANAAIARDRFGDISVAFEFALDGTLRLLDKVPETLRHGVLSGEPDQSAKELRRVVWAFLRSGDTGLPVAWLKAKADWLPLLKPRVAALLKTIEAQCGLQAIPTWKNNVTTAQLGEAPLWKQDLFGEDASSIEVKTVHKAKGQSINAVLYVAKSKDLKSLLAGPLTEDGRIGYVAITRACNLLLLAIPEGTPDDVLKELGLKGFTSWT